MSNIPRELAMDLIKTMLRIRSVEEGIAERYSSQEMRCPTHLSSGQEGPSAILGAVLKKTDLMVSGHRAHAHYLAKGGNLPAMLAEIYGKESGCSRGKGGSMHLVDIDAGFVGSTAIVGGTVPVGVGLALSQKLDRSDAISCIGLGDAVVETGAFYESLNFAILHKLPVLFFCENNLFSVYTPIQSRQNTSSPIHKRIEGLGISVWSGNGNDVATSLTLAQEAVAYVRSGHGPAFVELSTFRWREHCGPNYDDNLGYRDEKDIEYWSQLDAIATFEKNVGSMISSAEVQALQNAIDVEVANAFDFAQNAAFPPANEASCHVFCEAANG